MMFSPPKPNELRRITTQTVRNYLERHGWIFKDTRGYGLSYYEHPEMLLDNGNPVYYYFPTSDKSSSYPLDVLTFISSQSKLRDLTPEDIYHELTALIPTENTLASSQPVAATP